MKALVTGAAGFVGREVVKALCSRGVEVRCLVRTPGRERVLSEQGVDVHYVDITDPAALTPTIFDVDLAVHLVAIIKERGASTFDEVNRKGTENVVGAARDAGVRHFIQLSALGAVDNPRYPYLYSKWRGEQAVIGSGVPYTILRSSLLFGEGDEFTNALAGLVRAFPIVPIIGSGKTRFQPIAVDEVARCVVEAACTLGPMGKVIEIGGPDQLAYNEIVDIIARTYGAGRLKLHLPVPLVSIAVKAMEKLLPNPPVTTVQLSMLAIPNVTGLNTVQEEFGFSPRPLEGNIEFIKKIGFWDGVRIALGSMPAHIRDH